MCWTLQLVDGGKVGHHDAKCLGAIHSPKNLASDSLQFIRDLVGQREDEGGVDSLKRNVQPRAVVEPNKLRLGGLGFEVHDDVLCEGVLSPDFQHSKKLVEMAQSESGIDGEPELGALLCGATTLRFVRGAVLLGGVMPFPFCDVL